MKAIDQRVRCEGTIAQLTHMHNLILLEQSGSVEGGGWEEALAVWKPRGWEAALLHVRTNIACFLLFFQINTHYFLSSFRLLEELREKYKVTINPFIAL